ncbi:hypothetical protein ESA94_14440 [Lacibacter luteus]|uniref:TonB-dependent receptor n=1 Tax=Lacibacter luteus TaxID=2508719 RepID=A0A4Q1CGZ2_9BACT|nr:hypothetical protein [Lacibacter luteus]RXK59333.1 hypothetical protein ESA94_14440 [Lacibacter luteus]
MFVLLSVQSVAQVTIRGVVKSTGGEPLTNYILKIKKKNKPSLLFFDPAIADAQFQVKLQKLQQNDTLEVIIEKSSFETVVKEITLTSYPFETVIEVILPLKPKELKEIVIKPSVWRRGDTTIYTVDSFKIGEERKLKDILTKLPGFSIDEEGKLKFKNKEVAKILVEGEDLFADKTGLLLESFPAHVLAEVQAVENDPKNKLLAGVSLENETIINLKLKKQRTVFFGDVELAGATNKRYAINPTFFSVSRKTKWAAVGFHNNIGTQLNTVFPLNVTNDIPPGLQLNSIYQINNFSPSRYLINKLLNEQFVFNYPALKKLKMKTEMVYGRETLSQYVKQGSSYLNNETYFKRTDSNGIFNTDERVKLRQDFEWMQSNTKSLIARFTFQQNNIKAQSINYINQDNFADSVSNNGANHSSHFSGQIQYTQRYDSLRALAISFSAAFQRNNQQALTVSRNIDVIFSQAGTLFNVAKPLGNTNVFEQQLLVDWISKKGKKIRSQQFVFSSGNISLSNGLRIGKTTEPNSEDVIDRFSNAGIYNDLNVGYQSRLNWSKEKAITSVSWYAGASHIARNDKGVLKESKLLPVATLKVSHTILTKGRGGFPMIFEFSNKAVPLDQLSRGENAVQFNSFQQLRYTLRSMPVLNMSMGYTKSSLTGKSIYLLIRGSRDFVSPLFTNSFELFYNFNIKSIVNLPTNKFGIYSSQNYPLPFIRAMVDLHVSFDYWDQYISNTTNAKITRNGNLSATGGAGLKFNSFRKFSMKADVLLGYNKNVLAKEITTTGADKAALNLKSSLLVRYFLTKNSSAGVKTNSYIFDVLNRKQNLLFSDVDYSWRAPKGKFEFQLRGENLFAETKYVLTSVSLLSQNRTEIPLIGRNIQLSIKFNF